MLGIPVVTVDVGRESGGPEASAPRTADPLSTESFRVFAKEGTDMSWTGQSWGLEQPTLPANLEADEHLPTPVRRLP